MKYKIAFMCAYKAQVKKIRELIKLDSFFSNKNINDIEINTVDSFQGQERDIIIFSTVRGKFKSKSKNILSGLNSSNNINNNNNDLGFLCDFRRMNVALSRAKVGCFVVGQCYTLNGNIYWDNLINYCRNNNSLFCVNEKKISEAIRNIFVC